MQTGLPSIDSPAFTHATALYVLPCVEESTLSGVSSIAYSVSEPESDTCAT